MKESPALLLYPPAYSITYALLYAYQIPVVIYFPKLVTFGFHPRPPTTAGPGMLYYGWVLTAALVGVVVCLLIPKRWAAAVPQWIIWVPSAGALFYVLYHERIWFMP